MLMHLRVCVCVRGSLLHAGPSARGDNKHISPQTEAQQPGSSSPRPAEDYQFILPLSLLQEPVNGF